MFFEDVKWMLISKTGSFIIKWVIILYIFTLIIYTFIGSNIRGFSSVLTVSTILSILKYLLNNYNFSKVLSQKKPKLLLIIISNIGFMIALFISIYVLFRVFGQIDLFMSLGLILGVSYVPLVIIVSSILQSLYLIRNKF